MHTQYIYQAPHSFIRFRRTRRSFDPAAIVLVLILSALFAAAFLAALQPRTVPDAAQASVEGGL